MSQNNVINEPEYIEYDTGTNPGPLGPSWLRLSLLRTLLAKFGLCIVPTSHVIEKPFLVIMGDDYYPCKETKDWKVTFSTLTEAQNAVRIVESLATPRYKHYEFTGDSWHYDWYQIVDLRDWKPTNDY